MSPGLAYLAGLLTLPALAILWFVIDRLWQIALYNDEPDENLRPWARLVRRWFVRPAINSIDRVDAALGHPLSRALFRHAKKKQAERNRRWDEQSRRPKDRK